MYLNEAKEGYIGEFGKQQREERNDAIKISKKDNINKFLLKNENKGQNFFLIKSWKKWKSSSSRILYCVMTVFIFSHNFSHVHLPSLPTQFCVFFYFYFFPYHVQFVVPILMDVSPSTGMLSTYQ